MYPPPTIFSFQQIVKFLLGKRFFPSVCDSFGYIAIHFAAKCSSAEVMKLLLEKHASLVHTKSNEVNWTPLCLLCNNRFDDEAVRVASVLLDHGANIEQACGTITLHCCLLVGMVEQIWCHCCCSEAQT